MPGPVGDRFRHVHHDGGAYALGRRVGRPVGRLHAGASAGRAEQLRGQIGHPAVKVRGGRPKTEGVGTALALRRDAGFTMIELMVTLVVAGIMLSVVVGGWTAYRAAQAHRGTAEELAVVLRDTHQRAVTEGQAYCVAVTSTAWSLHPGDCSQPATTTFRAAGGVTLSTTSNVTFLPRGSATAATITVTRSGAAKVYTVKVTDLTGRVEVSA